MAAVRPVMYTDVADAELEAERPVSEETIRKIIQNVNMMRALCPVGEIMAVQVNIVGVPIPAPTVWQFANGGTITEPTSPLNGLGTQNVPDMGGRYLRGGSTGNAGGGSATIDLSHTHTLGNAHNPFGNKIERGDQRTAFVNDHTHGLDPDLGSTTLDPAHMECAFYFKIG